MQSATIRLTSGELLRTAICRNKKEERANANARQSGVGQNRKHEKRGASETGGTKRDGDCTVTRRKKQRHSKSSPSGK